MKSLRLVGETVALALALVVAFYTAALVVMAGLPVMLALAAGCLGVVVVWVAVRRPWRRLGQSRRVLFDLFLLSLLLAAALAALAFEYRWPLRTRAGEAHGWGSTGGEANLIFVTWLHSLFFLGTTLVWMKGVRSHDHRPDPAGD